MRTRHINLICRLVVLCAGLALMHTVAMAAPPVTANNCKSRWTLTVTNMDFGSFSNPAGTQTIKLDTSGGRTASTGIDLVTSVTMVYELTLDNTLDPSCGTFGLTLDWNVPPSDLIGVGTPIPISNVRAEYPAGTYSALPITLAPSTVPITIPFEATITSTGLQAAGTYTSGVFSLVSTQSGFNKTSLDSTASATAIVPLAISEVVPLDFGTVAGGPVLGTVILDPAGGRTTTGDGQALAAGPGTAGSFQVVGQGNQAYSVSYTAGVLDDGASGTAMTVDTFTDNSLGIIPAVGTETFSVGGTLHINASQAAGVYSTTTGGTPFTVIVNYN